MAPFLSCLLFLFPTALPHDALDRPAEPLFAAPRSQQGPNDENWSGAWEGRIEGKVGLPFPEAGIPFRLILAQEVQQWGGRLEIMGQSAPLTALAQSGSSLTGGVSLMGHGGTFRFELEGDSISGEFKGVLTAEASAQRTAGEAEKPPETPGFGSSAELSERLWRSQALAVPFAPDLMLEEKVAGLSLLWSEVKYNFAYFDQVPELDWDAEYMTALTQVMDSDSTSTYYMVLRELVAKLEDGHTNVYLPHQLADMHLAEPPIRTLRVEGTVIVTAVLDSDVVAQGMAPGLEVISIDGVPTDEYARRHIAPYVCSSTPQDRERQIYGAALLRGRAGSELRLGLQDAGGTTREFAIKRVPRRWERRASVEFKELDDGSGYLAIRSFQGDSIKSAVDAAMLALANTKGLIIDLRENPGGSSGWWVMEYLVEEYQTSAWATRRYLPAERAWGRPVTWHRGEPRTHFGRAELYEAPVVLLTSPMTASAAEDLASVFKYTGRGIILGEPTCGSTGQPLGFSLPGGGSARVCTKRDTYADGSEWVGYGVEPDVVLGPTIADFREGGDSILEAARALLR